MVRNHGRVKRAGVILAAICMAFGTSQVCVAQGDWSRAGRHEIFGAVQTLGSDTVSGSDAGIPIEMEIDSTVLFGLRLGTNITDHWNLNTDLLFGSADLTGRIFTIPVPGDVDVVFWNVNVDYNFFKHRLTPLVSGGLGLGSFSGDWAGGGDISETDFTYNFGVGGRWDVSENLAVKLLYRITWTELEDFDTAQFDGATFNVAYMFK